MDCVVITAEGRKCQLVHNPALVLACIISQRDSKVGNNIRHYEYDWSLIDYPEALCLVANSPALLFIELPVGTYYSPNLHAPICDMPAERRQQTSLHFLIKRSTPIILIQD